MAESQPVGKYIVCNCVVHRMVRAPDDVGPYEWGRHGRTRYGELGSLNKGMVFIRLIYSVVDMCEMHLRE